MSWSSFDGKRGRLLLAVCAGLALIAVCALLAVSNNAHTASAASDYAKTDSFGGEPAKLESIEGTDVKRVLFSAEGAKRVGLQTATISEDSQRKVIPYAAVIYDSEGNTFAYTIPERLTFVRKEIEVERVDGGHAVLSGGPPVGTDVVTVGATQVYGAEFEVAH